jgi:aminoglycoside phosphotransferase (APT) family kinase protein
VPQVEFVESDAAAVGRPFLVMAYIDGKSLAEGLREAHSRAATYIEFCTRLAQLHTLPWRHLPGAGQIPVVTVHAQLAEWLAYGQQFPLAAFDVLATQFVGRMAHVTPHAVGLVHWDFHWDNLLVDSRGRTWVIDWTQCQATDVRFDLAWTLILVGTTLGWETAAQVRAGYAQARNISLDELTQELDFFEAAACAKRLMSVLVALQYGAEALGMRPGAEADMHNALPSIAQVYRRWLDLTQIGLAEAETRLAAYL